MQTAAECNLLPDLLAIVAAYVVWDVRAVRVGDFVEVSERKVGESLAVVTAIDLVDADVHFLGWPCRFDERIPLQALHEPRESYFFQRGPMDLFPFALGKIVLFNCMLITITTLDDDGRFHFTCRQDGVAVSARFSRKSDAAYYFSLVAVDQDTLPCLHPIIISH